MLPFQFQDATYWGAPVPDGFGGSTFATPEQIKVRWIEKTEEFLSPRGSPEFSQAVVHLTQDVDIGGYLFLGTSSVVNPTTIDGAFPIKRYKKTPDLRNAEFARKAWL